MGREIQYITRMHENNISVCTIYQREMNMTNWQKVNEI